jgi:hypothetical protein
MRVDIRASYNRSWDQIVAKKLPETVRDALFEGTKAKSEARTVLPIHCMRNDPTSMRPQIQRNILAMECSNPITANAITGHHNARNFPDISCDAIPML